MSYESTITFTLDTICPWTYLGYLRLCKALEQFNSRPSTPVNFTLKFAPYQLYPDASQEGEDKYQWHKRTKYNDDEEKMRMYAQYMSALGKGENVEFDFNGTIANTLHAHRILQGIQENRGGQAAQKAISSLYSQYFTQQRHPSSAVTLTKACLDAGLTDSEANRLVNDQTEGLAEVKVAIQEQAGNGVDSVPYVVFEGKKRDFTLVGAKEVGDYLKTMEQVAKEA